MKIPVASIEYVGRSFSVIPIKPRGKEPIVAWKEFQTRRADEQEVRSWFDKWPNANVGTVTGEISEVVVIDLDSVEAKDRLKEQAGVYDLNCVPRSRTGKGWQLFFKHPGGKIPSRAGIFPGLDLRADGGYVVLPPSVHPNGKIYKWEVLLNGEFPKLPAELFKLITSSVKGQEARERLNTAQALAGVPQGQRDEICFKLACKLRNADVPQEMAEKLILEAARNCSPPFFEQAALEKVRRTYQRYTASSAQRKQPELWPEFLTAKDILQAPKDPQRWIWDGCLPIGGCSSLVAKPKIGKSTLAADLAISVSRGDPFLGRATQQCPVAYLFLDGTLPEIADVFISLDLKESDPVFLHAGSAPKDVIAWIMNTVQQNGVKLVIVDTMQKLLRLTDLNDYAEVTNKMEPLLQLARDGKAHVVLLHHAGKESRDDLDAAIGSTAIRGLCYTYLFEKRLPGSDRRILLSDQRGGKNFPETAIGFNRLTGRLEVQGTMEDAELEEAKPKIAEFLRVEGGELTEKEIRKAVSGRTLILSKALREMHRDGDVERTGKGKKGSAYRYSLSTTLFDEISDSGFRMGGIRGEGFGDKNLQNAGNRYGHYVNSSSQHSGTSREQAGTTIKKVDSGEQESGSGKWTQEI